MRVPIMGLFVWNSQIFLNLFFYAFVYFYMISDNNCPDKRNPANYLLAYVLQYELIELVILIGQKQV